VTGIIHDYSVADLSASEYAAVHQMRDKTFRQVMPVLGLTSFNMVLLAVIAAVAPVQPGCWALQPCLCCWLTSC
jgi:hypothetical protein